MRHTDSHFCFGRRSRYRTLMLCSMHCICHTFVLTGWPRRLAARQSGERYSMRGMRHIDSHFCFGRPSRYRSTISWHAPVMPYICLYGVTTNTGGKARRLAVLNCVACTILIHSFVSVADARGMHRICHTFVLNVR
jgi:hypothetical protein